MEPHQIPIDINSPEYHALKAITLKNAKWSAEKIKKDKTYFTKNAVKQTPHTLWIGCCDSRVPETTILDAEQGEIFVHRNVANIVNPLDVSMMSTIKYAVDHLAIQKIIVCGSSTRKCPLNFRTYRLWRM